MTETSTCLEAFRNEFDYLCRTLRRLGVQPQDVEDQVHEVFLVLCRKWRSYDPSRPLRPYLFGIAFRVAATHRRRGGRELLLEPEDSADDAARPDEILQAARARQLVLRALDTIPLRRRAVLVMHDIDEIPMREVTQALSIPLFTGYSRLRKARKELEAAIGELNQEPQRS